MANTVMAWLNYPTERLTVLIKHLESQPIYYHTLYHENVPQHDILEVIASLESRRNLSSHSLDCVAAAFLQLLLEAPPLIGSPEYEKCVHLEITSPSHEEDVKHGDGRVLDALRELLQTLDPEPRKLLGKITAFLHRLGGTPDQDCVDHQVPLYSH